MAEVINEGGDRQEEPIRDGASGGQAPRWQAFLPLVLALILGLYYLPFTHLAAGAFHDDGIYVATSRFLAEGKGYRIPSLPDMPLQTKYPVLFPALLALVWKAFPAFPANLVVMHLLQIALWLAALVWFYYLLIRFCDISRVAAFLLVLLWGLTTGAGTVVMFLISEPCFTLLFVGSLWFAFKAQQGVSAGERRRDALLCGLFIGLSFLARTYALVCIAGLALALLKKPRYATRAILLAALPFVVAGMLWSAQRAPTPQGDLTGYYVDYPGWVMRQLRYASPVGVFLHNTASLLFVTLPRQALPLLGSGPVDKLMHSPLRVVVWALSLAVTFVFCTGMVHLWRKGQTLFPAVLLASIMPLCLYPFEQERFLTPLAGAILYVTLVGARAVFAARFAIPMIPHTTPQSLRVRKLAIMGAGAAFVLLSALTEARATLGSMRYYRARLEAWQPLARWVASNVPRDENVYAENDAWLYLYTGHQGISDRLDVQMFPDFPQVEWNARRGYCPAADYQRAQLRRMRVKWFVVIRPPASDAHSTPNILLAHPEWFTRVYSSPSDGFDVYHSL